MSQPPYPQSGPDFGRRPSAGGFGPQDDYSHPDFPTGPPQQPPHPQGPYPQHHPMPQPPPRQERRSPAMGVMALFFVAIAAVIHTPLVMQTTDRFHQLDANRYDTPQYGEAEAALPTLLSLQLIPAALGVVGLILGIIAASTRRGTAPGVIAIVASVLAPILLFVGFMVGMQDMM